MPMTLLVLGFSISGCLSMLMVKVGGWVSIVKMLTDAYVRVGGWVRIFELLTDAYAGGGDGCVGMVELLAYVIC